MARCKNKTGRKRCPETAVFGGYCEKHRKDGGGGVPKPSSDPKGGGGGNLEKAKNATGLVYFATKIYEFIRDNWPDISFSEKQLATYKKLKQQRSEASQQKVFAEFLSGLTAEQWGRIVSAFGLKLLSISAKRNASKQEKLNNET